MHLTGAPWAMALSRQHRQRLRRDPGSRLSDLTSIHVKMPPGVWGLVDSDGYCGYAVIMRLLTPSTSRFDHTDVKHRIALQQSLIELLSQLPQDFPEEATARARLAIRHLDSAGRLPRNAWCHMDLVMHVASTAKLPFWTPGRTPLHSRTWLGPYSASTDRHPTLQRRGSSLQWH